MYFEVLEDLDTRYPGLNLKVGSNPAEGHNRDARAIWRHARNSDIKRIEQSLLTLKGYIVEPDDFRASRQRVARDQEDGPVAAVPERAAPKP